jgi:hypothetical protein
MIDPRQGIGAGRRLKMGKFPNAEPCVTALAEEVIAGLADHSSVYPAPPIEVSALTAIKNSYIQARSDAVATRAAAEQATVAKDALFTGLVEALKKEIRYAENTVDGSDEKLKLIGWSARKPRDPVSAPGQTRLLTVRRQEEAEIDLSWKVPAEGGKPIAYRVLRRQRPDGSWTDVATAIQTRASLTDQPRGTELEFRVLAVNRAGVGEPSNTVVVVL